MATVRSLASRAACAALLTGTGAFGAAPQHDEAPSFSADDVQFFTSSVQPLLEEHCVRCHGGGKRVRGGLRLTSRQALLEGGDRGPAYDVTTPADSLLLDMVSYRDEHTQMPPSGKLDDQALDVLTRWVERGLPWADSSNVDDIDVSDTVARDEQSGWSYRPLDPPAIPPVPHEHVAWTRTPVDAFILARLTESQLAPRPEADRRTLIRRATYDLLGLPPTPGEIDAFVRDPRPDAYERLIDDLLSRPQYGEKWGRHWLDAVRYAETNGFERDSEKPHIWRYRDYVVRAFNDDKPYDRFLLEQLAGDELDDVTHESLIATGYHRLMQWDDEPGQGRLQARYDTLDDLVSTTSQVFLGMTLGCARCHDHKGDPLPQEDYYRFMAYFHGVSDMRREGTLTDLLDEEQRAARDAFETTRKRDLDRIQQELTQIEETFVQRLRALDQDAERAVRSDLEDLRYCFYRDTWTSLPDFTTLLPEDEGALPSGMVSFAPATRNESFGFVFEGVLHVAEAGDYTFTYDGRGGARLTLGDTVVLIRDGIQEPGHPAEGRLTLAAGGIPFRLECIHQRGAPALALGYGLADRPWAFTEAAPADDWTARDFDDRAWSRGLAGFGTPGTPGARVRTEWSSSQIWLRRTFEWTPDQGLDWSLAAHHDEDLDVFLNGTRILRREGYRTDYAAFPLAADAVQALTPGRNVLAVSCRQTAGGQYVHADLVPTASVGTMALDALAFGQRPLSRVGSVLDVGKALKERGPAVLSEDELARHRTLTDQRKRTQQRRFPVDQAFVVREEGMAPLHVHVRGNAHVPGDVVEPGVPQVLAGLPAPTPRPTPTSSGRRRALAEWMTQQPLTARVLVNRLWHHHFGRGLVRTTNDFGEFGSRPTHPQLLEWLAHTCLEHDWSLKSMHRLLMRSAVYRQDSLADEKVLVADARNDLYSRFDRRRLTAEEFRDTVLAVTGRLSLEMEGPSMFVPMPEEALATASRPDAAWGRSPAHQAARRSVYIKVKRSLSLPLLATLDAADTDMTCPERFVTTTPNQALTLFNGAFTNLHAEHLAARLARDAGPDLDDQLRYVIRIGLGRDATPEEIASHHALCDELTLEFGLTAKAATTALCLTLLNLNEFAFVD